MHSLSGHSAHFIFELFAYFIAAKVYWSFSAKQIVTPSKVDRFCMLAGAVLGAAIGSKLLHDLEHLPALMAHDSAQLWLGGKSVLGGFIGGTLGVELAKRLVGWKGTTGDPWAPAIATGLVLGRIGCQLSGIWDLTYGSPTSLPWAWDYGDGIGRHPTALYEILLVVALFLIVWPYARLRRAPGARFAAFLMGYCAIRFAVDFLKPPFSAAAVNAIPVEMYAGLSAIQWAAVFGFVAYSLLLRFRLEAMRS